MPPSLLQYRFLSGVAYRYLRTMQMESDPPPLQGLVVSTQEWKLLEERNGLAIVTVREEVRQQSGPLTQGYQVPPAQRKVYLDGCGLMPKGNEEFAALSPFPMLCEDWIEENQAWVCTEGVPNSPDPLEITYRVLELHEEAEESIASLSSQGANEHLEVEGTYSFSVTRGLLLRGQLRVINRLPDGQKISLVVDSSLG